MRAVPEPICQSDHYAFLRDLSESLGRAIADNGGAVLVHVSPSSDGADVGMLALDDLAPADALLGAVAPEHWSALGVATRGWARSLDRSSGAAGAPVRAEVVVLVARDGHIVGRARHGDQVITEPPAYGLTLDCLQRALGLPTAPPDAPATQLVATAWLELVLDAGRGRRRPLSWSEIRSLYPVVPGGPPDWGQLRWLVVEGRWQERGLTPADAAWLDDGAFSRWALSRRPPLAALLAALAEVIGPADARRCARELRRAGVETAA